MERHLEKKEVPPGEESKLRVVFKTDGAAGRTISKTITVKTNAPDAREFKLVVKGMVEQVAKVNPNSIVWHGETGEILDKNITITPSEKYPFSILEINQRKDSKITATLIEPEKKGQPWQINVKCSSTKADAYYDNLIIKTDSQYKKKFSVRVYATFIGPKPESE